MKRLRLALTLMAVGSVVKGGAVVVYHLLHQPLLAKLLVTYDPLGVAFAEAVLPLFFDLRGIAPPPGAPAVYEVVLVLAFALQCFLLGFVISEVRRLFDGHRRSTPAPNAIVE